MSTARDYQQEEVDWYTRHGQHQADRIVLDWPGRRPYVIGDADWHRAGRPAELIDDRMAAALRRVVATPGDSHAT